MLVMSFIKNSGKSLPTSFSLINSYGDANLTAGAITMPADILEGDIMFLGQACNYWNGGGTPSGWNDIGTGTGGTSGRINMCWKIADGTESGTSLTGLFTTSNNLTFSGINHTLLTFRANRPIDNIVTDFVNARWGAALEQFDFAGIPADMVCMLVSYSWNRVSNAFGTGTGVHFNTYNAAVGRNTGAAFANTQPTVRGCMSWRYDLAGGGINDFNVAGSNTNSPICGNAYTFLRFT